MTRPCWIRRRVWPSGYGSTSTTANTAANRPTKAKPSPKTRAVKTLPGSATCWTLRNVGALPDTASWWGPRAGGPGKWTRTVSSGISPALDCRSEKSRPPQACPSRPCRASSRAPWDRRHSRRAGAGAQMTRRSSGRPLANAGHRQLHHHRHDVGDHAVIDMSATSEDSTNARHFQGRCPGRIEPCTPPPPPPTRTATMPINSATISTIIADTTPAGMAESTPPPAQRPRRHSPQPPTATPPKSTP